MHVTEDGLADFVAALRHVRNFAGAVVTMPHKTRAAQLVDTLTDEARLVGAVNVIRREGDATLSGTMLDGEGFVSGLATAGHAVSGTRCILYGAGGAASSVAVALARHGCSRLTLQNRTRAKAESLAVRLRKAFPSVRVDTDAESADDYDIAVNGTSLGMKPTDALPFGEDVIDRAALIAECVIAPEMTRLLELARSRGRIVHTGIPMLTGQLELMLEFMGVPR
jgi:shikimate dehydrogenase